MVYHSQGYMCFRMLLCTDIFQSLTEEQLLENKNSYCTHALTRNIAVFTLVMVYSIYWEGRLWKEYFYLNFDTSKTKGSFAVKFDRPICFGQLQNIDSCLMHCRLLRFMSLVYYLITIYISVNHAYITRNHHVSKAFAPISLLAIRTAKEVKSNQYPTVTDLRTRTCSSCNRHEVYSFSN